MTIKLGDTLTDRVWVLQKLYDELGDIDEPTDEELAALEAELAEERSVFDDLGRVDDVDYWTRMADEGCVD